MDNTITFEGTRSSFVAKPTADLATFDYFNGKHFLFAAVEVIITKTLTSSAIAAAK